MIRPQAPPTSKKFSPNTHTSPPGVPRSRQTTTSISSRPLNSLLELKTMRHVTSLVFARLQRNAIRFAASGIIHPPRLRSPLERANPSQNCRSVRNCNCSRNPRHPRRPAARNLYVPVGRQFEGQGDTLFRAFVARRVKGLPRQYCRTGYSSFFIGVFVQGLRRASRGWRRGNDPVVFGTRSFRGVRVLNALFSVLEDKSRGSVFGKMRR